MKGFARVATRNYKYPETHLSVSDDGHSVVLRPSRPVELAVVRQQLPAVDSVVDGASVGGPARPLHHALGGDLLEGVVHTLIRLVEHASSVLLDLGREGEHCDRVSSIIAIIIAST